MELQSSFHGAGKPANFDYIRRPALSLLAVSPQPITGLLLSICFSRISASVVTVGGSSSPSCQGVREPWFLAGIAIFSPTRRA